MGRTKILLGGRKHVFWEGLIKILSNRPDVVIVCECSTGLETIQRTIELKPDIVFIDEIIQDCGFLEVAQQIKESLPEIHTVIVTKSRPSPEMLSVLKAEASAYIDKDIPVPALFTVIERIKEKGVTICPILADQLIKSFSLSEQSGEQGHDENKLGLSRREEEVLALVGQGVQPIRKLPMLYVLRKTRLKYI